MHMRITIVIDEGLLRRAEEVSGISERTALVRAGLEALIAREAAKRLGLIGGTQPTLTGIRRRRSRLS